MQSQLKLLGQLLTPSWLSGLVAMAVAFTVVIGTAATLYYNANSLQFLGQLQDNETPAISRNSDTIEAEVSTNQIVSNIPLLIFWAGVGVVVYALTMRIVQAFGSAIDFGNKLHYTHTDRRQLIRQALLRSAFRILALLAWLLYVRFTINVLVPYVIALAYAGSGNAGWLESAGYLFAGIILTMAAIHLHTVMLRLVLLRPRAFGQAV